ncbi:MAG TPA: glycosyltransferase family 4 protein [Nitrospira sp.]|nr:glycosyltransferase family 4 protein [Nitrospira sp.]
MAPRPLESSVQRTWVTLTHRCNEIIKCQSSRTCYRIELPHNTMNSPIRLLLIGGMPPPIGGTTVLFRDLVERLSSSEQLSVKIVNTSRAKLGRMESAIKGLQCVASVIWNVPRASVVSFHTSMQGAIFFGPLVHLFCRVFGRKWIFRGFGGYFESWYGLLGRAQRWIFDITVLRADAILFERISSVQYFRTITRSPVHWYPNNRSLDRTVEPAELDRAPSRRFVFLGHVKPSKGIGELIAASRMLHDAQVHIDVYGPLQKGIAASWFDNTSVQYRGIIAKEQVMKTLVQYDALILPTYWEGEGHPGVILEAYCAGIPVIATRWGGIPEIVDSQTGILVKPRDAESLAEAMRCLIDSDELLERLRNGARRKAAEFDSNRWTQNFIDLCSRLVMN